MSHSKARAGQQDAAFQLETEGIGVIATNHRHGMPRELFFVWFAAVLTFTGVVIGQLFTALGLNVWESFLSALICSISFALLGYASSTGPKAGTVTLTISRAAFGPRGNKVPAFFSWLSAVGWESVTMVLTVWALLSLAQYVHLPSAGTGPTIVALIITLVLTYTVPLFGHATVISVQRVLSFALAICAVLVVFAILPLVHWGFATPVKDMAAHGSFATFILATSIGLISTFYGWVNFAADYSRYLPSNTKSRRIVGVTFLGGGIANFVMMGVGILLGTFISVSAFNANPVMAIAKAVPAWAAFPFLLVVVVGDIAANYLNAYSSGMSFLSMGIKLPRYWAVAIDGVICTAIGIYALFFSPNFVSLFQTFLDLNIVVIGPWATIFLVHHFMIRGKYDEDGLTLTTSAGAYWYSNGINYRAMIAFLIGAIITLLTVSTSRWTWNSGVLSLFGNADISAFAAPIVTGVLYYLLSVRKTASMASFAKTRTN